MSPKLSVKKQKSKCAICLETLSMNQKNTKTLSCSHTFHSACIRRWLQIRPACPYCNTIQRLASRTIDDDRILRQLARVINHRRRHRPITRQYAQALIRQTEIVTKRRYIFI